MSDGKGGLIALIGLGALAAGAAYMASEKKPDGATPQAPPGSLVAPIPIPASAPPIPTINDVTYVQVRTAPFLLLTARDAFKSTPWNISALCSDLYTLASPALVPYLQQLANWLFTSGYAKASEVMAARASEAPNLASLPVTYTATLDSGLPMALRSRLWSLVIEQRWEELGAVCQQIQAQYPKTAASFLGILQTAGGTPYTPQGLPQIPPILWATPVPQGAPPVPAVPPFFPPQAQPPQGQPPAVIPAGFPAPPGGLPPLPQIPPVPPGFIPGGGAPPGTPPGVPPIPPIGPQTPPGGGLPPSGDKPPAWWPTGVPWPGSGGIPGGNPTGALYLPPGASWDADNGMIAYIIQNGDYSATKIAERFKKKQPNLWAKSAVVANPGKKWGGPENNIHVGVKIWLQPEWGMTQVQTPPVPPAEAAGKKPAAKPPSVIIQTDKPMPKYNKA